ncbi:Ppx/GppA phosphatase family protein [Dictyobacter kobayashii]|uniref:CHAD domain-containing protein n=1 Tax=Dictyobacter kobayashii TaxID=2014872 RepID=A0A402AF02_9CHLR|nr:CHAD domain-containing protein [Dictyobacter kobayashii]GCE17653.1 hypothetical protein KDK_14530 [Dictyobacter kobayashii]
MPEQTASVCAAIDIGSNTLRVVVARCSPADFEILAEDEALVRIGESVNSTGAISAEKRELTISVLKRFQSLAQEFKADTTLAIATEAIRKAKNRTDFLQAIQQETGIEVHCIGGDVEATLTFYGATYTVSKLPQPPTQIGVMDMGGGSTELVFAKNLHISWHTSLPIGSGWLHDRYLQADPPTVADQATARTFLRTYLGGLNIKSFPPMLFVTGGSANSLLLLSKRAFSLDEDLDVLTYEDLLRCEGLLWALPAEEVAQRYQLDVQRARIITAGALILRAILETFHLKEIHVSSFGIREGLALAYCRDGERWLQRAQQRAESAQQSSQQVIAGSELLNDTTTYHDDFGMTGRRMFQERAEDMLSWREAVLRRKDIEAVHKMRVASRRLRATMDAYQSVCDPKKFSAVYRQVKEIADVLGVARDTDVMIENLHQQAGQGSLAEQQGCEWLVQQLTNYRQEHQEKVEQVLRSLDERSFMRKVMACLPEEEIINGKG